MFTAQMFTAHLFTAWTFTSQAPVSTGTIPRQTPSFARMARCVHFIVDRFVYTLYIDP